MRILRSALLLTAFGFGATALAEEPGHAPAEGHGVEAPHGAAAGEHGAAAAGEQRAAAGEHGAAAAAAAAGEHGAAGAHGAVHHADYTGDHDGDGTANWRDSDSPDYALGGVGQHLLNLVVLIGVLFYFARTPVVDSLKNRAHGIRKEITEAARLRDEATQRNEELAKRLASFEEEVKRMKTEADAESRADEAKLVARAREEAARIAETAERNIRDEVSRARYALRKEAVDLAVMLAEQTLRSQIESEDQRHLARAFLESLNRDEVNGNG